MNLQLITNDLNFLIPLLKQYPKCYWLWNYRLWLLEQAEAIFEDTQAAELWEKELILVNMMLTKDGRNFHGWDYRRRIVAQIERLRGTTMAEEEFAYTTKMIRAALHNFSALHYRSKLIPRLLDERKAEGHHRRAMLNDELELIQNALIDPNNQSPWFYHQFLMSTISPGIQQESAIVLDLTTAERVSYYEREIERIEEILETDDDCKWVYEALLRYSIELNLLNNQTVQTSVSKLRLWLSKLRQLDSFRTGRWDDLQHELQL
jgi:geranylgeranyl transferase type-2 subunit alpha